MIVNKFYKIIFIYFFIFIFAKSVLFAENNQDSFLISDYQIKKSLTDSLPNPELGKEIVISRRGNCLACHQVSLIDESFQGNIGPSLDGVANRYTEGELRLRLVDPYSINPNSLMPAFFKKKGLNQVGNKFLGKTILTAQQIEDVISWLLTLK